MKTSHFFFALLAILFFSCNNSSQEQPYGELTYSENANATNYLQNEQAPQQTNGRYQNNNEQSGKRPHNTSGGKKQYQLKDPSTNMIFGTMPIPNSWRPTPGNKEIYLEGPNGIKVYNDQSNFFHYSTDAGFNQFMKQNGNLIKPTMRMEEFFNNEFKPMAEKAGNKLINKYPLKQMANIDSRVDAMFFKATPENTMFEAMVTEWVDNKGLKSVIIVKHKVSDYGQGRQGWGYTYSGMEAGNANYEQAKNDFINALLNVQINPQYVQMSNQKAQQQTQQFNNGHNVRMATLRSQNRSAQQRLNQTYSDISDITSSGYQSRSNMQDAGHSKFINSINETSNMTDNSGNQYQVEGYSNNTWVNSDNQAIQTDNYNYNPNIDTNTNNTDWQQLNYSDDGSDW